MTCGVPVRLCSRLLLLCHLRACALVSACAKHVFLASLLLPVPGVSVRACWCSSLAWLLPVLPEMPHGARRWRPEADDTRS